jgi:nitrogen fixation protein NifU and related proteins
VSKLNKLYDDVIKRHNAEPYHFLMKPDPANSIRAYNPICGDRFDLFLELDKGTIRQIHFHGFGCAVSKSSTSVLAKTLEGKSMAEAKEICRQFLRLLKEEISSHEILASEEFKSFAVVREIPARYDCAALAWEETLKFLASAALAPRNS